jgi:hypothetical protein
MDEDGAMSETSGEGMDVPPVIVPGPAGTRRSEIWRMAAILMGMVVVAAVMGLPYLMEFVRTTGAVPVERPDVLLAFLLIVNRLILSAVAIGLGLWLGNKIGLGAPVVKGLALREPGTLGRIRSILLPGLIWGLVAGILITVLSPVVGMLWPELTENETAKALGQIASWKGVLVSVSAGVIEEIQFRFGLMTLLAWCGMKLMRRQTPGATIICVANVLAVVPFGLAHLTNVAGMGVPITLGAVLMVVLLNGVAGVIFGILYWRRGIETAILAHFATDIVLKAIVPMFG